MSILSLSAPSKTKLTLREMIVFAMFGTIMVISKKLLEWAPNIHLLGMLTMVVTVCYRAKGLIPLYIYVFLNGLIEGFSLWWMPYTYIWTVLWGVTMLLPRRMPARLAALVYPVVCGLHGFAFGTLYAPAQALIFGFDFEQTVAWIVAGLPFDAIHAMGNLAAGVLVLPLCTAIREIEKRAR